MSPEGEGGTPDPSRTTAATSSSAAQALSSSKSRDKYGRMGTIDVPEIAVEDADERTALLPKAAIPTTRFKRRRYKDPGLVESQEASIGKGTLHGARTQTTAFWRTLSHPKAWSPKAVGQGVITSVKSVGFALPAVFLGWLLNVLDALSYGTILFPLGEAIFEDTGPDGIAIFFVSTVISQVVYSCRSKFKGGVGSEMIEVVPFFHKMAYLIMAQMGATASTESITSTVYISYILSSVLTGIIFLLLGVFKLGNLVSFFPRSILTGCIGGVGVFLFLTGIEVSAGINGNLEFNMATLEKLLKLDTLPLWTIPLVLAIMLFVVRLFSERPWIVPVYFISIMVIFYIVVAATPHLNLEDLRGSGWVFEQPRSGVAFYHFYSFYSK